MLNGVALVVVAVLIVVAAIGRLSDPPEVAGAGVLVLGLLGLAGNAARRWCWRAASATTSTSRRCCATRLGDALSSLGVVVAGAVVLVTGWDAVDPLVSILIAVLIAASSWRLLKEPFDVLMEAAPAGMDVAEQWAGRWPRCRTWWRSTTCTSGR